MNSAHLSTFDLIISGTVQGVGFRSRVLKEATRLGICGYVENLDDGTVGVLAQGDENRIKSFVKAININEEPIDVTEIKQTHVSVSTKYSGFEITYSSFLHEL